MVIRYVDDFTFVAKLNYLITFNLFSISWKLSFDTKIFLIISFLRIHLWLWWFCYRKVFFDIINFFFSVVYVIIRYQRKFCFQNSELFKALLTETFQTNLELTELNYSGWYNQYNHHKYKNYTLVYKQIQKTSSSLETIRSNHKTQQAQIKPDSRPQKSNNLATNPHNFETSRFIEIQNE